jgi:hypothetical protein
VVEEAVVLVVGEQENIVDPRFETVIAG